MVKKNRYKMTCYSLLSLQALLLIAGFVSPAVEPGLTFGILPLLFKILLTVVSVIITWIGMPEKEVSSHTFQSVGAVFLISAITSALYADLPITMTLLLWVLFLSFSWMSVGFISGTVLLVIFASAATGHGFLIQAIAGIITISFAVVLKLIKSEDNVAKSSSNIEMTNVYKQELHHDHLTGVFSRSWFMHNASEKVKYVAGKRYLSVAMIDIDHFKHVNDTYGHEAGDIVLKRLGKLLTELHSSRLFTGRYGGEEFCIMFDAMENDKEVLDDLRIKFGEQSFDFTDEHFSLSGGIYQINTEDITIEQAIKEADKKLYYSKEHGRNQITK